MARLDFRFQDEDDAAQLAEALWLEGPIGRETAPKIRALAKLAADEESPDFEPEHLNVLARVLAEYEWRDPGVYAELKGEVMLRQLE
jgi:hypothetical protein